MEGYYWRLTDAEQNLAVVALCGICQAPDGSWATIALAAHPDRLLRPHIGEPADADPDRLGVRVGTVFVADEERLTVDLGDSARLEVALHDHQPWPHRIYGGLGPAHWIPGLGQYWHPHLLGGRAHGELITGKRRVTLANARVYAEKNWGSAFPRRWWWGQAHDFDGENVCVAFAGGELTRGVTATGIVVRLEGEIIRLSAPLALVHARADAEDWQLVGRGPRHTVVLHGRASGQPYTLPVPIPAERRQLPSARQQLAGAMRVTVRRGRRLRFSGETQLAGLEFGD